MKAPKDKNIRELPPCLPPERNLVLIGYRATGKTEVGALLAKKLGRPLVDLDQFLEAEMGQTITALVADQGWAEFRRREKEIVARFSQTGGQVLATGGGVVLDPENVALLRKTGVVVWLQADPHTIRGRLSRDRVQEDQRPSLTGGGTLDEVEEVLNTRRPLYAAAAHVVIDTTGQSIDQVVEKVQHAIKQIGE
ncbi:MAG: shikimate kinase [Thermodesulfobacteriota bacterium]